ncbi:unnamed protein product [Protopolystoma xenopodis]|uniref:Uncharacterized protein n=1 Tax=Protopolystoma xenopodis TaxID=117903 RepID=A0A3S5A750_9PLAT|nr:unnamed protein product [Protopolystoma xenopodis]
MCNGDQAGYRFGANYAGHKKVSENEAYPVLQGEVQPNGQVQAQIVHQFAPSLRMQYMTQLQKSKMSAQQIAADFRQGNWQTNLTVINPDLQRRQVMTALGTMCQVTRRFALGSMFFYHRSPQLPAGQDGTWSIGGKYSGSKWTAAASLRPFHLGLHSSFHMRYDETLQFAAELESNFQQQNNTATIGYQFDFPKGAASVKAQIDSNWNIAASLEKKMFPFTFTLCAMGNQSAERYAVGFGLSLLV